MHCPKYRTDFCLNRIPEFRAASYRRGNPQPILPLSMAAPLPGPSCILPSNLGPILYLVLEFPLLFLIQPALVVNTHK